MRTDSRSLAAALIARYPEMIGVGFREREPGLVCIGSTTRPPASMLAARNAEAFRAARALFESSLIEKRYLAVVDAAFSGEGVVETLLGPDTADPRRVRVYADAPDGYSKLATTRYRVVERGARFNLVELSVERAFRHQNPRAPGAPRFSDRRRRAVRWSSGAGARCSTRVARQLHRVGR